jgi:hypothetical protein
LPWTTKRASDISISTLTTSTKNRKSSKEAHAARKDKKEFDNIYKSAYKVATMLYHSVQAGENTMEKFSSAEKVATQINELFGVDFLSGFQLKEGVKNGRQGLSPPRRGPEGRIPEDEFKAVANLVFTAESIEQANCTVD